MDIEAGEVLVESIKPIAARTHRSGVLGGIGGFAALFELPGRFRRPVLVSGTDGVGTKLKLACELDRHDTIGIDLVAMCANDVLVQGAEPLFFLDYFATSKLDPAVALEVIRGIGRGCELAGAALVGGETAEMPGMYAAGEYDLAGFCVGAVEKDALIDGSTVAAGDVVVGLGSSGPHSNGYSLIRKVVDRDRLALEDRLEDGTIADELMSPTMIYVKPILALFEVVAVKAIAHITGGGIASNIARVIPPGISITLNRSAWPRPAIFGWIQEHGRIEESEMLRTFNCGLGMAIVVPAAQAGRTVAHFQSAGLEAWEIGNAHVRDGEAVSIHE